MPGDPTAACSGSSAETSKDSQHCNHSNQHQIFHHLSRICFCCFQVRPADGETTAMKPLEHIWNHFHPFSSRVTVSSPSNLTTTQFPFQLQHETQLFWRVCWFTIQPQLDSHGPTTTRPHHPATDRASARLRRAGRGGLSDNGAPWPRRLMEVVHHADHQ